MMKVTKHMAAHMPFVRAFEAGEVQSTSPVLSLTLTTLYVCAQPNLFTNLLHLKLVERVLQLQLKFVCNKLAKILKALLDSRILAVQQFERMLGFTCSSVPSISVVLLSVVLNQVCDKLSMIIFLTQRRSNKVCCAFGDTIASFKGQKIVASPRECPSVFSS